MGSTHMREFIAEFYSKTIISFDKNIKPIILKNTVSQVKNELYTQVNTEANVFDNTVFENNVFENNVFEKGGLFSSLFSF
jgi:hypothetical protein